MRSILLFLAAALATASAERLSLGLQTGVPLTAGAGRWTVGPLAELALAGPWSLEGAVLYRRPTEAGAWDIPILLRYRVPGRGALRPILGAGYQLTHESQEHTAPSPCADGGTLCLPQSGFPYILPAGARFARWRRGPAASAGIEIPAGRLRLTPELRYVHLNQPSRHHLTLLLGFRF